MSTPGRFRSSIWLYGALLGGLALVIVVVTLLPRSGRDAIADCERTPKTPPVATVRVPDPDIGVEALALRKETQLATIKEFEVFHDFQFTDRVAESGITFVHRGVDDAGKYYKAVHYDHGTGIAVADVTGDGRYDVYFVNQLGGNELWKNLGNGKFRNITAEAGVGVPGRVSVGASFADLGNSGRADLYVTTVRGGNLLFRNDGKGHFTDVSKESGLDYVGHSSGAVFLDYNRDGLLDLFLVNVGKYTTDEKGCGGYYVGYEDAFLGHLFPERTEYSRLYKNLGNHRFADVTKEVGLLDAPPSWSGDASFVDLRGDGYPDLYVLNMQGANHFYENQKGERFVDKTAQYFPRTPWGAMGIKFFDWNNDGRLDLFITDMHSDMFEAVGPPREKVKSRLSDRFKAAMRGSPESFILGNAFYENHGDGKFEEISDRIGAENYWPWGVSVGDLNADGWEDMFIGASMSFPFHYGINSLLLNNRGKKFLDSEFLLGVEPRREGRTVVPWFEIDCSAAEGKGRPYCSGRSGKVWVLGAVGTRSAAIFDLDGDGDLDIVTNEFNSEPMVLISNLAEKRAIHWVKIKLVGTTSNRSGLGATVKVVSGRQVYTKWNDGKSGYLSQSVLPLYFGLGDTPKIDRIEVRWPSGTRQVVTAGLKANSTIEIVEKR